MGVYLEGCKKKKKKVQCNTNVITVRVIFMHVYLYAKKLKTVLRFSFKGALRSFGLVIFTILTRL